MYCGTKAIMGVDIVAADLDTAASQLIEHAQSGGGGYACLCNVHVLVAAQRDEELRASLVGADFVFADGYPVAWLQRRHGDRRALRVAGPDLMGSVIDRGRDVGLRHFLFGSTPEVVDGLLRRIEREWPGAEVVGAIAPPFGMTHAEEVAAVASIRQTRPDVVWCGFGAPKQELLMRRISRSLEPSLLVGVGAAFDFLAETKPRAPEWMQRNGLEWLHRLATEPRRLAGRYVRTNSEFVVRAGVDLARARALV